jgi:hypothetical protein
MRQIQMSDQLYQEILRRATADGFAGVDDFVTDRFVQEFAEPVNYDHLFTPERIAKIQAAVKQMDAGLGIPEEQVREHFRRRFES